MDKDGYRQEEHSIKIADWNHIHKIKLLKSEKRINCRFPKQITNKSSENLVFACTYKLAITESGEDYVRVILSSATGWSDSIGHNN